MPRGQASSGHWNFHVTRYKCPDCNRKGLHMVRHGWVCMYQNCPSRNDRSLEFFKKITDDKVLQLNPEIKETGWYKHRYERFETI